MLNPFPELLVFGFFAPTLLRLAAAGVFLYVVSAQWERREAMAKIPFPIIGTSWGMGVVWVAVIIELIIAGMLLAGYYTQIAALLGMVAATKYFYFEKWWPTFAPLSRVTSVLLFVILISLLLSGAGALAYDLPL